MIDNKGNRVPLFVFENIQNSTARVLLELNSSGNIARRPNVIAVWPGGLTKVPDDEPECVFNAETCKKGTERKNKSYDKALNSED